MIRFKLSYKLFAAFFLILTIVTGAMILARYIFSLNFHSYINQIEIERLQTLAPVLQEEYRNRNSWQGVKDDLSYWSARLDELSDIRMNPPLDSDENDKKKRSSRILLTDAGHKPLIGSAEPVDDPHLVPLEVDGETVGWLGLKEQRRPGSGPPAALLERQARHLTILGAVVIGVTALFAFLFSRHLLVPIQQLINGTRKLSGRDFSVRIKPSTRDELGELAEKFNDMAETLETYETMRRQWLSDISHELRTPLAVLRGEIEALQDGIRDPNTENLGSLHTEIVRLNKLVEDLHLLSITESGRFTMERQDICPGDILSEVVDRFQTRLEQCSIKTRVSIDARKGLTIVGDSTRLSQVFVNIIENACKYMEQPGLLQISCQPENGMVSVHFDDSGPGVVDASLPRLFDRLYRVENSRSRETGGSGLGLSICRHIVVHHGGTIEAAHSELGGLLISINLPLKRTIIR